MRGYNVLFGIAALAGLLKLWEEEDLHLWHIPAAVFAYLVGRALWRWTLGIPPPPPPAPKPAPAPSSTSGETMAGIIGFIIIAAILYARFFP